jgi:PST family polysaccharide transporter
MLAAQQSDLPRLKRTFQFSTGLVSSTLYLLFVGIAVTAPEVVSLLFGAKWLPSAPYVTALALLVLVQAPRLLVTPMLTALGRPRDLLLERAAELAFVVAAVCLSRTPTLAWAVGIWIVRELLSLPITSYMLKRSTALGLVDQLRGITVPLLASGVMALVVYMVRLRLPLDLAPVARLAVLSSAGGSSFLAAAYLFDRELVKTVWRFAQSAVGRQLAVAHVPSAESVAPQSSPAK